MFCTPRHLRSGAGGMARRLMDHSMQSVQISVIVVTYNGSAWIEQCLKSVLHGSVCPHVIVVDNASTDGTHAIVDQKFPQVQLLRLDKNVGFGQGNNVGIQAALSRGDAFAFLLNQDAFVLHDSVAALLSFMQRHPEIGACSPLHCSPDKYHLDRKTLRGYLQTFAPGYLADACMGQAADHYLVRGVNAAAWFVRTDVWRMAGGFDPLFFMYGEDDDLLYRWAHHRILFALLTDCRVVHLRQSPKSAVPNWSQDIKRRCERRWSELLNVIKQPAFSTHHMVLALWAHGWLRPLADFLERRDLRDYLASQLAAWRVLLSFMRIRRHARLSATHGSHFL